jgi:hypothetical protein
MTTNRMSAGRIAVLCLLAIAARLGRGQRCASECPDYEVPCEGPYDCVDWMNAHCLDWLLCCESLHCNSELVNKTCDCYYQCPEIEPCCATASDCYDGAPQPPPAGMAYVCVACSCCLVPIEEQSYWHPESSPSEISEGSSPVSEPSPSECPVPGKDVTCDPFGDPEGVCGDWVQSMGLLPLFDYCRGDGFYACPDGRCATDQCIQNPAFPCCLVTPDCYRDASGSPIYPPPGEAMACVMCMCLNVSLDDQSYWHPEDIEGCCVTELDCLDYLAPVPECSVPTCVPHVGALSYNCCGLAPAPVGTPCFELSLQANGTCDGDGNCLAEVPEPPPPCCSSHSDCRFASVPEHGCIYHLCEVSPGGAPNCCVPHPKAVGTPCFELSLQANGTCDGDGNCVAPMPEPPPQCCSSDDDCAFPVVPTHGCIYHLCEALPGGASNCCVPHLKAVGTPCDDENPMTNDSVCSWNGTCVGVCPEWPWSEFPSPSWSEDHDSQSHSHGHGHPNWPFCGHGIPPGLCRPCPGCNSCPPCPQCPQCPQCPPPCQPPDCPECPQCPQCPPPGQCPDCPQCPTPPGCPQCPDCPPNPDCPECPVPPGCPECPSPPECPECNPPQCPDCPTPPQCPDCNPPQCPECPDCPDCPPPPPPPPPCPPPCPGPQCEQDDDCGIAPPCYEFQCRQHVCVLLMQTPGAVCHDGNPCTINDVCDGYGRCAGTRMDCDDDEPCTRDWCQAGNCRHTPIPNCGPGPSCPEPEPQCTTDESCGYTPPCHHFECIDGQCVLLMDQVGTDCDDGDACTRDDECDGYGRCIGRERRCDDQDPCTDDRCEDGTCYNSPIPGCTRPCQSDQDCGQSPYQCETYSCVSGHCVPLHDPTGTPCDDGNICTTRDACDPNGRCVGICDMCDDQNPCTEDSCHPLSGCSHYPILNCVGPCTQDADCPPSPNPCMMPSCQQDGTCTFVPRERMTPCDDGNPCTGADKCDGDGSCVGICDAGICDDQDPCTTDSCHPVTGCAHEPIPNCLGPCSTAADCPQPCSDCFYATCSPEGVCGSNPKRPGSPCDDGLPWTTGDACDGQGNCVPEEEDGCDDGLPETDDYYDYRTQSCVHVERLELLPWCSNVACEEDADCRTDRPCLHGACLYEVCCYLPDPTGEACDDGNECTTGDHCHAGACLPDGWNDCDDSDGCTTDRCVPGEGCSHDEVPNCLGPCTHDDNCTAIAPVSSCLRPVCTDGYCSWEALSDFACDDSNPCTQDDTCIEGECVGTPVDCDDQEPCTKDVCDLESGCTHEPIPGCSCAIDGAAGSVIPIILLVAGVGGAGVVFLFLLARPARGAFGRAEVGPVAGRSSVGAHSPAAPSRTRKRVPDSTI